MTATKEQDADVRMTLLCDHKHGILIGAHADAIEMGWDEEDWALLVNACLKAMETEANLQKRRLLGPQK